MRKGRRTMAQLERPHDVDLERELIAACFTATSSVLSREDIINRVVVDTQPGTYVHPHYQKIYVALTEAVKDAGKSNVEWGDVRGYIDKESQARRTLSALISSNIPPVTPRWLDRHITKLIDLHKCRRILQAQQQVATRALAGDAENAYNDLAESVFAIGRESYTSGAQPLTEYLPDIHVEVKERRLNDGVVGLRTGMRPIDDGLGGLQKKTLTYIGGRPGSMKSTAVGQAAYNVAEEEREVALVASPEMSAGQYATRWACRMAGVDYNDYNRGRYDQKQEQAIHEALDMINHENIIINESGLQSIASLRQDIILFDPKLLVIDYSQLFEPSRPKYSEYADVTMFSKELNSLKKDFGIAILAAVQLSRKVEERPVEERRPIKSDVRSSGQIEQDADAIYMLYREREYATQNELGIWEIGDREIDPNRVEWVSAKNRHGAQVDYDMFTRDGDIWLYDDRQG